MFTGQVQEPTEIILDVSLENFWIDPNYLSNYTVIDLGKLTLEVIVMDKKTNERYVRRHPIDIRWISEKEYLDFLSYFPPCPLIPANVYK